MSKYHEMKTSDDTCHHVPYQYLYGLQNNVEQSVGAMSSHHISKWIVGFLSAFGQGEGMQVRICVQSMWHTPLGNLLDAIWWNLGLFSYKQNLPFLVTL